METHEQFPVFVIDDGARSFVRLEFCLLNFPMGDFMKHTPWTPEDADKWAKEIAAPMLRSMISRTEAMEMIHEALAKAAEMIETSPTVFLSNNNWREDSRPAHYTVYEHYTHRANLVGVRPIDSDESGSKDQ